TVATQRNGCSGGGVRRLEALPRYRCARVARQGVARARLSRERDACARRDSSRGNCEGDDGGVVRSARSRGRGVRAWWFRSRAQRKGSATGVRRDEDLGKTDGLHPSSKLSAEDAVAITAEKPGRRVVGEGLDNLLRRPSRGRGIGHVEM